VTEHGQSTSAALTYDEANRKNGEPITWPDGTEIAYGYSAHGELQSVTIPGEGAIDIQTYSWTQP
jgi:YD repeat-containing protein